MTIECLRHVPLGQRIHAVLLAPLLAVYLVLGVFIWLMLDSLALRELENKGNHIIASTSSLLQGALISGDKETATTLVESIANDEDIVAIRVRKGAIAEQFVAAKGVAQTTDQLLVVKRGVTREMLSGSLWETPDSKSYQQTLGQVELTLSKHRIHGEVNRTLRNIAIAGLIVLALAILLGRRIGKSILMPLEEITSGVARIASGDYAQTLQLRRHDELGALGDDIDALTLRLATQQVSIADHFKELVDSREEAERLNDQKTELLMNISREYGNPLTAAIGNLQKALRLNRSNNGQYINKALEHVEYLSELNIDVEQLAHFDQTQAVIRKVPLKLDMLLTRSIDAYKSAFDEKGINVVVDWGAHTHLAHETIYSDPIRLRVVLNNLLVNAAKSVRAGSGEIVVRVFMREHRDDMSIMIDLIFSGTGAGAQSLAPLLSLNGDTGVDLLNEELSIDELSAELRTAHQILRAMGGELSVCNTLRGGARILLQLAVARGANQDDSTTPRASELHKIMIVEKPRNGHDIAIKYLRAKEVDVDRFSTGQEAIQAASLNNYTMIFIDNQLPDLGGQGVVEEIRALPAHNQTPLIAMVTDNDGTAIEPNLDAGFDDQLHKPITGRLLLELVEGHRDINNAIYSFLQ